MMKKILQLDEKIVQSDEKKILNNLIIKQKKKKFTCNQCNHVFERQIHLENHLEKKSCKIINYKLLQTIVCIGI